MNAPAAQTIFDRILIGVDGTKESLDACRQAARLAAPDTTLEAVVVLLFPPEAAKALGVEELAERLEQTANSAMTAARDILGDRAELRRLQGMTVETLLDEAKRTHPTLLAIGPPAQARVEEIFLGGVGGELLHRAACAVLVARPVPDVDDFPRSIVVGIDGSEHADGAYEVARQLATRFDSELRVVLARGGKHLDVDVIRARHPDVDVAAGAPVPALLEAGSSADLLVVGSRGLHGLRALGSVSERVAHEAPCSVLVVR